MSTPPENTNESQELTPEALALLKRARRSFAISMGLLILGLMAVVGVVVYRTNGAASKAGGDYVIAEMRVPAGAEVISTVAADGKLTLTYKLGALTSVRIYDGKSGTLISEVPVVSE